MRYSFKVFLLITTIFCSKLISAQEKIENEQRLEAFKVAYNAYIWGYPLVALGVTALNDLSGEKPKYTINNFTINADLFKKEGVSSTGNIDDVYSKGYLDLSQGAILVTLPVKSLQYYSLMVADAYSNNFGNISSLRNPTKDPLVLITGPNWTGTAPKGVKTILKSPTNFAWVIGRTSISEQKDIIEATKTLESIKISVVSDPNTPKSWIERNQFPKLKPELGTNDQINAMDWKVYFLWLSKMMRENPIYEKQMEYVSEFKKIGLTSTKDFDGKEINARELKGIKQAFLDAKELVKSESKNQQDFFKNGWLVNINEGKWGNKYSKNAASAYTGFDQTQAEEIIKLKTTTDAKGEVLIGSNTYKLVFKKGQLPPNKGFWTINAYDENNFLVESPKTKYAITSKTKTLKLAKDGSLTIYMQDLAPKGLETNWLTVPNGTFKIVMKVYYPGEMVSSGEWIPAAIEKVSK